VTLPLVLHSVELCAETTVLSLHVPNNGGGGWRRLGGKTRVLRLSLTHCELGSKVINPVPGWRTNHSSKKEDSAFECLMTS
jgi:hypothetical protein